MELKNRISLEKLKENENLYFIFNNSNYNDFFDNLNKNYIFFYKENYQLNFCKKEVIEYVMELQKINSPLHLSTQLEFIEFSVLFPENAFPLRGKNKGLGISSQNITLIKPSLTENVSIEENSNYNRDIIFLNENNVWTCQKRGHKKFSYPVNSFSALMKRFEGEERELCLMYLKLLYPQWNLWRDLDNEMLKKLHKPIEEVTNYQTKHTLLEYMFKKESPNNLNRLEFDDGFGFMGLIKYIDESDYQKFYEFILKRTIEDRKNENELEKTGTGFYREISITRKKMEIIDLLALYIFKQFKISNEMREAYIVRDYINMCISEKKKVNLKIKSYKRILREHDDLSLKITLKIYKKKMTISDKYKRLKLPKEFILLKTTKDIAKEGTVQKHCVVSYLDKVNRGRCVIYTTIYKKEKYTLEICLNKAKYTLEQIKGFRNCEAPEELVEKIEQELKTINEKKVA